MTLLLMIVRKMFNNRWIVGSMLLGMIIIVALVTMIPAYTNGVLQNMMTKEFEQYQLEHNDYPGTLYQYVSFNNQENTDQIAAEVAILEGYHQHIFEQNIGLPHLSKLTNLSSSNLIATRADGMNPHQRNFRLNSLTQIESHIHLIDGAWPSADVSDGVYEVLVSEQALLHINETFEAVLGTTLQLRYPGRDEAIEIKPVGVFRQDDPSDLYWTFPIHMLNESFVISDEVFRTHFMAERNWLSTVKLYTVFDYHQLKTGQVPNLFSAWQQLNDFSRQMPADDFTIQFPILQSFGPFFQLQKQFTTLLWLLNIPVLILLGLYLLMITRQIIDRQRSEIAVIISRGSSKVQIIVIYFIEVTLLAVITLAIAPWIGLSLSRMLGAANGFLTFVQRQALPIEMTSEVMTYALWAIVACIVMVMVPVILSTRENIVSQKRGLARLTHTTLWHKLFLDVVLILIAWYGWRSFRTRQADLAALPDATLMSVDPLLFFIPALFIIGVGLFLLRLYPWLIKGIYWLGHKYWSPALYSTLIQVGRAARQYQFLMIFLIMTIAIGIYSASAARTINTNLEEQLRYMNGSDVVLQTRWESNAPSIHLAQEGEETLTEAVAEKIFYAEPPFNHFNQLPGVEHVTKVFKKDGVRISGAHHNLNGVQLMGIEPKAFGLTAWNERSLLARHWNEYLNLLAGEPSAVLLSTNVAERLDVQQGDYVTLSWRGSEQAQFVVYGLIDYWPSWDPRGSDGQVGLVVANLPYVQLSIGMEPYEVWLKLAEGASSEQLFNHIFNDHDLAVTHYHDVNHDVITMKNSAYILGINGSLTLGFLISMFITFCGFLIYWILTIGARVLQYGVLRAMGMSLRELFGMLAWEQMLTSGMAIFIGIVVGAVTSRIFVPLFELSFASGSQVTPFRVIFDSTDEMRIYAFVALMLLIGLAILIGLLSRIRVHQAVKLGED